MINLIVENFNRVLKNRRRLEKTLHIDILGEKENISIEGEAEDEYIAEKVFKALDFGFPMSIALLIKTHDYMFEVISIKEYTRRRDLGRVRARIIGKKGKALKTLSILTQCYFELKDNTIGIIGDPENIKTAQDGLTSLIQGSKHANVYSYLEKHQPKKVIDLGLRKRTKTFK